MDLRRNRLDGWLTRLQPAPTLDKYREKDGSQGHRRACAAAVPAARVVNSLVQNVAMQLTPGRLDVVCQRLGWDRIGLQRAFDKAVKQLAARA